MKRVQFVQHNGKEILFLDFSQCTARDALAVIEEATAAIRTRPHQSLLTLTDVTGTRFDDTLSQRMKEFTAHNKPYVRAAAVVGITGLKKIIFEGVMLFSKRKIHTFDDHKSARAWLITH